MEARYIAWVKKWKARFRAAPNPSEAVWGRSRAHLPKPRVSAAVVEQILAIRDEPPESLYRTPGPKAILYYLPRTPGLQGERLPRSTRTIWKILHAADRIAHDLHRPHCLQDRPEPLVELQLDLARCRAGGSGGICQAGPRGGSLRRGRCGHILVAPRRGQCRLHRGDRSMLPCSTCSSRSGCPSVSAVSRDPRFLGSTGMRDFPTPFVRFWYAASACSPSSIPPIGPI